jgi:hypothetical protein
MCYIDDTYMLLRVLLITYYTRLNLLRSFFALSHMNCSETDKCQDQNHNSFAMFFILVKLGFTRKKDVPRVNVPLVL